MQGSGGSTHYLRDREMLRKRKAEAQKNDSIQWATGQHERSTSSKKRRGAGRGRGRQPAVKPMPKPKPEAEPEPPVQKEAELVPPIPEPEAQSSMKAIEEILDEMQGGALEEEMASGSYGPLGEEEMLKLVEETPEDTNAPLRNETEGNEYFPSVLF